MSVLRKIIRIVFPPQFPAGPYAFRIMKAAYDNNVKGECHYQGIKELIVIAEGEELNINDFLMILKEILPDSKIDITRKDGSERNRYKEFDILPMIQH